MRTTRATTQSPQSSQGTVAPGDSGARFGRAVRINRAGEEAALFAYSRTAELRNLGGQAQQSSIDTYV